MGQNYTDLEDHIIVVVLNKEVKVNISTFLSNSTALSGNFIKISKPFKRRSNAQAFREHDELKFIRLSKTDEKLIVVQDKGVDFSKILQMLPLLLIKMN
jgi:hypothetical protein